MKVTKALLFYISLAFHLDADKNRPVARVVQLLKEMQAQLEKEQKEDEEVYDKMACWCKTNDREKTKSIKDAEQAIDQLTAKIEEYTAQSARLNTEIQDLNKEISANQQSLDKAIALRAKQLEEFNAEEKDLLQSITSLKAAIVVLSKHHPSMLQEEALLNIAALLRERLHQRSSSISAIVTPSQKRIIQNFIQAPSYNAQSGEIFGILKNMQETFESNLSSSRKEEEASAKAFVALKAAKNSEIAAGQQQADTKTTEYANAQENGAQAKSDLEDTRNSLSADEQFLMVVKEKCKLTDDEWEQRQKTRHEEILAVSQAIGVLANDDARDNFTKVYDFMQVDKKGLRTRVSSLLSTVATTYNSPRIAQIAASVRLDAFTKVKAAIDGMVTQLLVEKEDEVQHKDWCVSSIHKNQSETQSTDRDRTDEEARIDTLKSSIQTLSDKISTLASEIAELQVQLKRAGEDRERQNADFQVVLNDQREAQRMLKQALIFLKGFYEKKQRGTAFAQQPAGPAPPAGFKEYKKNAGSQGVLAMIQQIIADTKAMEAELIHDEDEAQKGYESIVKETNRSLSAKNDEKVDTESDRAKNEGELNEAENNHAGLVRQLEQLTNHNADLHGSCDFVLKNFDIRQQARDQEVEALRQAKAVLSGSNFQKFLQQN
eukprot:GEMP01012351.1.p1 GENE.GEMP01012351.1~~GEMP01012351.1.p1  ORF type:complete len:700 (+),score=203.82 GEMP01012351.1:121-2100(+)